MDSLADSKDDELIIDRLYPCYPFSCCKTRKKKLCFQDCELIWETIFYYTLYEITGKELNDIAKQHDLRFSKYLNEERSHNRYNYKCGKNVDTNIFYPHGECNSGGLYFTLECLIENFQHCGDIIVEITVDDDARVWIEDGKMKANKINIVSIIMHSPLQIGYRTYPVRYINKYCHIRKGIMCYQTRNNTLFKEMFPRACVEITGKELNIISRCHDMAFAKRIVENNEHTVKHGKHIAKKFCPHGRCIPGGIYFTLECLMLRYEGCGETIVEITVDDNARVWIEDWKMKADKINIVCLIYVR